MASDAIDRLQGLRSGVAVKAPARAVSTSNITLSGEQTVDGVALVAGDRALVTGQTSAVGNGVYDVSTGAWTRSLDFDGVGDLTDGTMLLVLEGTSYGATMWRLDAAGVPDEDDLTFSSGVWVADGAIGTAELASLCVTAAKLAADSVTAAKLATDAVETAKIKDANVTAAKLAADSVTAAKLATDAVETAKIKDANVTAAKLAADIPSTILGGLKFSSGSIANPGSTGDKVTSGLGFRPRLLFVMAVRTASLTPAFSLGWAASDSSECVLYHYNTPPTETQISSAGNIVNVLLGGVASVASFDADGFTLNWSSYTATMGLAYLAIGW